MTNVRKKLKDWSQVWQKYIIFKLHHFTSLYFYLPKGACCTNSILKDDCAEQVTEQILDN